ncbi:MAG: rRNA maturation RNase YbeY [Candidatus Niyogibacteria bacterium]|nr:rRNA maturation RNase YbeY [Candidatus Niyogibacteria bacterium]
MVSFTNLTRRRVPGIAWDVVAARILGRRFEISVVFVSEKRIAGLKRKYPPHGYSRAQAEDGRATNVLSFLIGERAGEIFLCPRFIEREAPLFERGYSEHLLALYIHGLLHLKGFDHNNARAGKKMASAEVKYFNKYKS